MLFSNKGPSDPDPRQPLDQPEQVLYPWLPGRWYDLPVVMPQNACHDLDKFIRDWHTDRWLRAGGDPQEVASYMVYFFPYWCGWGYWWWWWNAGDCTDIGVGEGESLDVEQVNPVRVSVNQWPPP